MTKNNQTNKRITKYINDNINIHILHMHKLHIFKILVL